MPELETVEGVAFHVVIDNVTDSPSPTHAHAETEFAYQARRGMSERWAVSALAGAFGEAVVNPSAAGKRHEF